MKIKKGVPCPVAALANSDKCLGTACGWFLKEQESCLIGVQSAAIADLIDKAQEQERALEKMGEALDTVIELLKKVNEANP
jgi:uncharacterized coiled-coil protein SlyX